MYWYKNKRQITYSLSISISVNIKRETMHYFEMLSNLNLKEQIMCCQRAAHRTRNAKSVHVNILQIMKNCMNQNVLFQSLNVMIAYYDFSRILYKLSILKIEFD